MNEFNERLIYTTIRNLNRNPDLVIEETINEVARFLQSYIINHFATEENYMNRTKYPDYPAHKSAHDRYRVEFNQLKEKIEKEGVGLSVSVQMNHLLIDWWLNHINKVDKKMADFIKDKI